MRGQNTRRWLGALALPLVLGGCAATAETAPSAVDAPSAQHTMPDGTVMDGSEHPDGHHGEHGSGDDADFGPSDAARMVCGGDVAEDLVQIMDLSDIPEPSSAWAAPVFACTYELAGGPLVLRVHDVADEKEGRAHFDALRDEIGRTTDLEGMDGLGLPAYQSDDGTAVFIRDGKTLEVDATAVRAGRGDGSQSRADIAYAVATAVLACWTAHD